MNSIIRLFFLISLGVLMISCKADVESESESNLVATETTKQTGAVQATKKTVKRPKRQKPTMSDKTPASNSKPKALNNADAIARGESVIGGTNQEPVVGQHKFWNNRTIRFYDYVGNTGDLVYEQIKGMKYFENTRIFIYSTDKVMEGSMEYSRVEDSMKSTRLDDRIFIWAHFDENRSLIFLKTLISDNIKDDLDEALQVF